MNNKINKLITVIGLFIAMSPQTVLAADLFVGLYSKTLEIEELNRNVEEEQSFSFVEDPWTPFLNPNETTPYYMVKHKKWKQTINHLKSGNGIIASLGSERALVLTALSKAKGAIFLDYDVSIVVFHKLNTAMLAISHNLENYRFLRYRASHEQIQEQITDYSDIHTDISPYLAAYLEKLSSKKGFQFWYRAIRKSVFYKLMFENQNAIACAFGQETINEAFLENLTFKEMLNHIALNDKDKSKEPEDFQLSKTFMIKYCLSSLPQASTYLFDKQQFNHLQKLAQNGKMLVLSVDLGNKTATAELFSLMASEGLKLGLFDFSNAWSSFYLSREKRDYLKKVLMKNNVINEESFFLVTTGQEENCGCKKEHSWMYGLSTFSSDHSFTDDLIQPIYHCPVTDQYYTESEPEKTLWK